MEPDPLAVVVQDLEAFGVRLQPAGRFAAGETRSAHLVTDEGGRHWVMKWAPAAPEASENLERLVALVDRLRDEGYPAPQHLAIGQVDDWAYWIQERMPGEPVHSSPRSMPDDTLLATLARQLVDLADLHADAGDLAEPPWPDWLVRTLTDGGVGYCLHETMRQSPVTARMLERITAIADSCKDAPVRRRDICHFDFTYANALTDGHRITGVIDWNVPFRGALQGDHAFDIATLLFYAYDRPPIRDDLWRVLLDRADPAASALYLAHLTLRQAEWVVRFYPGSYEHRRFLAIGRRVLDDLEDLLQIAN